MGKEFIVSVGDVLAYDPNNNDAYIFKSETEMENGMTIDMDSTEVRGGYLNQKLFEFYHSRSLGVDIVNAQWDFQYMALNAGNSITNGASDVWKFNECQTLVAGAGTTDEVPVGDLIVTKPDDTVVTITPTGSNFTVPGLTTESVQVSYQYNETVDTLIIDADTAPKIITLVEQFKIVDQEGEQGILEITIPRFQVSGSFELSMTPDGVSSTPLSGTALSFKDATCGSQSIYAYVRVITTDGSVIAFTGIAVQPTSFEPAVGDLPETQQLTVLGLRSGGMYAPAPIAVADCTFSIEAGGDADITVDTAGLITVAGTAIATDTATVKIVHDDTSLEDYVLVEVQA